MTQRKKIAVLNDYQNVALRMANWSEVQDVADISVFTKPFASVDAAAAALEPFEIVCLMRERTPMPRDLIERLPRLRLIASTARHNASVDMQAAADNDVAVAWTDGLAYGTPELTWGLILSAMRHLPEELASVRAGGWQTGVGSDIHGRTLGIIGLGNVGKVVARVGAAFGMRVIAWSQNLDPEMARSENVIPVDKESLFRQADIISLHMVLSERTRHIVGVDELALMKPSSWLVNASRGPLVDEAALIAVLESGAIAGAALDAYAQEPLPQDHPFRRMKNVLASPHLGFVTEDTYKVFYGQTVENILAWLRNEATKRIIRGQ